MAQLQDTTYGLAHRNATDLPGHWEARVAALTAIRERMIGEGYSALAAADYALAHLDAELEAEAARKAEAKREAARDRARAKAEYIVAGGLNIRYASDGSALVPSGSTAGVVYRVCDGQCSCPAGESKKPCWHVEAAAIAGPAPVATKAQRVARLLAERRALAPVA